MDKFTRHVRVFYLLIFMHQAGASQDCPNSFFLIEQAEMVEGKVVDSHPNVQLDDCVAECARHKNCGGANFLIDLHERPTCLLVDVKRKAHDSETPNSGNVMYSTRRICTHLKVDKRQCINKSPWSFEKFANYNVRDEKFILQSMKDVGLDKCLLECDGREGCAAAIYSPAESLCRLSRVSLHNINSIRQYFFTDNKVDLYESNCVKKLYDTSQCNFMRVNRAGFTDVYDVRIKAASKNGCEEKCVESAHFTAASRKVSASLCRAYTFDAATKICYLSHTSQRAFGRNVLDNMHADLSYGDLENCIQFNLDCMARSLILRGKSMKLFHGFIRAKQKSGVTCERNITESNEFSAEFNFHACHLHRKLDPLPVYSSLLVVKEGSTDLITVHDKMIQVSCRLHNSQSDRPQADAAPNARFDLLQSSRNATHAFVTPPPLLNVIPNSPFFIGNDLAEQLLRPSQLLDAANARPATAAASKPARPKYALEVLDRVGRTANIVDINDVGFLQITMNDDRAAAATGGAEPTTSFFVVSDLVAESVAENKSIELIDSRGCVSNARLVKSLRRIGANKLQIEILFSGFQDQARVTYQTFVKRCSYGCFAECNRKYFESDPHFGDYYATTGNNLDAVGQLSARSARAVDGAASKRHFALAEDLHEIRSQPTEIVTRKTVGRSELTEGSEQFLKEIEEILAANSNPTADNEQIMREELPTEFWRCVADTNCVFTLLFVSLQLCLLASCVFVLAVYVKQLFHRIRIHFSAPAKIRSLSAAAAPSSAAPAAIQRENSSALRADSRVDSAECTSTFLEDKTPNFGETNSTT